MDKLDAWLNRTFDGTEQPKKETSNNTDSFKKEQSSGETVQPTQNRQTSSPQPQRRQFNDKGRRPFNRNTRNDSAGRTQGPPGQRSGFKPRPQGEFKKREDFKGPARSGRPHSGSPRGPKDPADSKLRVQQRKFSRPPQRKHFINPDEGNTIKKLHNHPFLEGKLKVIPLGGLNEVGKNMMAFEYENDIIIIDMGFEFPGDDMLGIDYIIPDISYLEENKHKIRGVIITHAHLDHIGGVPYMLPKLNFPPLYGAKLTIGLIKKKIEEFNQEREAKLITIDPDQPLQLGKFLCNFFRVVHSIPDSLGVIIDTPVGKIVHTGDFKFDENPAGFQQKADIHKMEALGSQNVLALFSDSTNSLKPGHSMSEQQVGEALEEVIKNAKGRLIIASFSSLIGRIQQIIENAQKYNRKIFVSGRSMIENMDISKRLGYLAFPEDLVNDIKQYRNEADHETLILTTGSQGEAVSALNRIANDEHPHINLRKGDTVVLSSSPIVGNERAIHTVINQLCLRGANVIHNQILDVHASGHGYQDELIRMINYIKPKYFLPVHGEFFMRQGHALLATEKCGIPEENIIMLQNGDVLIGEKDGRFYRSEELTVETKYILIDGLGEGHVGSNVQINREVMSKNGAVIIILVVNGKNMRLAKRPEIVTRGFIYMHEADEITREMCHLAEDAYRKLIEKNPGADRKDIKRYISQTVDKYTHTKLERSPLIVPLIVEV